MIDASEALHVSGGCALVFVVSNWIRAQYYRWKQ